MPDLQNLIDLVTKAITEQAAANAHIESLHASVGELKGQMQTALNGIGQTQKDIVLALERLNTNLEDHKVIHQRITDLKAEQQEQRERIDGVEHSCSKEKSDETAAKVDSMEKLLLAHGIVELRDGEKGHGTMIAEHDRFVGRFSGKLGWALLALILLGAVTDFTFHYDFIKRITGIFTG